MHFYLLRRDYRIVFQTNLIGIHFHRVSATTSVPWNNGTNLEKLTYKHELNIIEEMKK